jgi:2-dehydropantoate 2-reductase
VVDRLPDCPVWAAAIPLFPVPPQQQTEAVAQATGDNFPSMLQDVRYRRSTEIERITGYLCARASHYGIATPVNTTLLQRIRAVTTAREPQHD